MPTPDQVSSPFPAAPSLPLLHAHGGKIRAVDRLPISALGDDYTLEGSGTITTLPGLPVGVTVALRVKDTPTFKNSAKLICPNAVDLVAQAGDLVVARSDGSGTWRLFLMPRLVLGGDGSAAAPSYTFTADTDSGLYRIGANNVGIAVNGTKILDIGTAGLSISGTLTSSGQILNQDGSVGAPGYSFSGDTNTGLRRVGSDDIALVAGGADIVEVTTSSVLLNKVTTIKHSAAPVLLLNNTSSTATVRYQNNGSNAWDAGTGAGDGTNDFNHYNHGTVGVGLRLSFAANALSITGALSKGSGTFHIDHPLDPERRDLFHAFIEGPRYDLIYRGEVVLMDGRAVVDIDAASRMSSGTFAALTQNARVVALHNQGIGGNGSFNRVRAARVDAGKFEIHCEDASSAETIHWVVMAERADAFIKHNGATQTDDDGRMIPEQDKPPVPQSLIDREAENAAGHEAYAAAVADFNQRRDAGELEPGEAPPEPFHPHAIGRAGYHGHPRHHAEHAAARNTTAPTA